MGKDDDDPAVNAALNFWMLERHGDVKLAAGVQRRNLGQKDKFRIHCNYVWHQSHRNGQDHLGRYDKGQKKRVQE